MIHVERIGSGEPSLLLHGFAGSGFEMMDLAERLPGRKLIPDLPGHGHSSSPPDLSGYTMEASVDALVDILDDSGCDTIDVVGYSMGGRVALGLAALHPNRVRSAVAIGARIGIYDEEERATRRAADQALAEQIEERGTDWFARTWLEGPIYRTQHRLGSEHIAAVLERRRAADPSGIANSLRALGPASQPLLGEALASSGVPVLLLVGELDERFRGIGERIAAVDPAAVLRVVSGAGHATHVEAPDETARFITRFWEEVR